MSRNTLRTGIEQNANTDLRIGLELTEIVVFLIANGHIPRGSTITTPDLEAQCGPATYSRVRRLVNEMGMVNQFGEGPDTYVIHTRLDEIVNGQNLMPMVNEELKRVLDHAQQDPSIRQVVVNALPPNMGLQDLHNGGFVDRRSRLDNVVTAIRDNPNVTQGNYGRIIFRTPPNHYRATPLAVQLYNQ